MTILFLTFYFKPDLCAGSFRNTALVDALARQLGPGDTIHVVTTQPNRYGSFRAEAPAREEHWSPSCCRIIIDRVAVPTHASGLLDQMRSFRVYYRQAQELAGTTDYDLAVASSSRLFTALLGARLARSRRIPLVLDIRDLFRETILDVFRGGLSGRAVRWLLNPALRLVEWYTFGYAQHINLVSEGFRSYFRPYRQATYSYFTNGIDEEFLHIPASTGVRSIGEGHRPRTLLYAGNIGEGQGLHKILPQAARLLGDTYRFVVIGDGGARQKLVDAIDDAGVTNVELRPPVNRQRLIELYQQADYLFVHLNDLPAFERVLPSKLFEYGATDKPIVAGVAGYAARFVQNQLDNALLFEPGDAADLARQVRQTPYVVRPRADFTRRFARKTIMQQMARTLLQLTRPVVSPATLED